MERKVETQELVDLSMAVEFETEPKKGRMETVAGCSKRSTGSNRRLGLS
jgi:hypothetical protein